MEEQEDEEDEQHADKGGDNLPDRLSVQKGSDNDDRGYDGSAGRDEKTADCRSPHIGLVPCSGVDEGCCPGNREVHYHKSSRDKSSHPWRRGWASCSSLANPSQLVLDVASLSCCCGGRH